MGKLRQANQKRAALELSRGDRPIGARPAIIIFGERFLPMNNQKLFSPVQLHRINLPSGGCCLRSCCVHSRSHQRGIRDAI